MSSLISCNQHDYLEIVCMFHYHIEVYLTDGSSVTGVAQDVYASGDNMLGIYDLKEEPATEKREVLVLVNGAGYTRVYADQIERINVLSKGARFTDIRFKEASSS